MDEDKKQEIKKSSIKMTLNMIIRSIMGIPHTLTGIYLKISMKLFKKAKNKKAQKELETSDEN